MAKYVLLAPQWDQVLSKPHEPFRFVRHRKGAKIDLTGADERRLLRIGAVEPVKRSSSKPAPAAKQDEAKPEETPDLDASTDEDTESEPAEDDSDGPAVEVEKPAKTAPVAAWRDYAVAQGMDADEAGEAARADLIALYG